MKSLPSFLHHRLKERMLQLACSREPDEIIPPGSMKDAYMLRWFLTPSRWPFKIYLHLFIRSDDDRALHDHPWPSLSYMLYGEYVEWMFANKKQGVNMHYARRMVKEGELVYRSAKLAHRIELIDGTTCLTLFMVGRKSREWGFHCRNGWRHWKDFGKRGCSD